MLWLIFVLLLILIFTLLWVLFTPVIILIDSESKAYQVCQKGTLAIDLVPEEGFKFRFKVMGMSVNTDDRKKRKKKKARKKRKWKVKQPMKLLRKCMKALTIKVLNVELDTDDVVLNAKLVPLAYFLSNESQNRHIHINFEGQFLVYFLAEIRLHLILVAFVKHLLKR